MVHIVGAGPGAPDLITVRGQKLLETADVVIYAGSLVNSELLAGLKEKCRVYNSALMTLEEVLEVIREAEEQGLDTVRLHTGDPCLYGAIREQMDAMDRLGISYDLCPGVSSFCGAAAALGMEYTLPGVSQSVVITRMAGRTPVPDRESVSCFAAHGATMVVFLSAGLLDGLQRELLDGGYQPSTPAAIVYKATWPEEKTVICRLDQLADTAGREGISKTALVIVGDSVSQAGYDRSLLYHPQFTTEFRKGEES
ncbi:precorrin-4 C(11)-methyltransferase [Enterocloster lavalensis]|uniref:precorrin-4 C(11)-methyltransferase n=1 Tax=Enterocloster lavalensis TaxID=460384 RepID=UPI0023F4E95A|nr:precorrin-4 C(11)-methyltransferase [Enterocloster lavalensis]